jgi:hypothetical protein
MRRHARALVPCWSWMRRRTGRMSPQLEMIQRCIFGGDGRARPPSAACARLPGYVDGEGWVFDRRGLGGGGGGQWQPPTAHAPGEMWRGRERDDGRNGRRVRYVLWGVALIWDERTRTICLSSPSCQTNMAGDVEQFSMGSIYRVGYGETQNVDRATYSPLFLNI